MRQLGFWMAAAVLLAAACTASVSRPELTVTTVPADFSSVSVGAGALPDSGAEYGILADMDGDGVDEWVLVYFAGTAEIIDRYAIVLFSQKDGAWQRTDYLDSSDPALPAYFRELTPDLPPNPENLPESLVHFPYPRGEGWSGGPLSVWQTEPSVALPVADIDGKPGLEVLVPMTGFDQWRILFLALRNGVLNIIGDVEGLEFAGQLEGKTVWAGRKTGGGELKVSETQWYTEYRLEDNGLLGKVEPLSAATQEALYEYKRSELARLGSFQALAELAWYHRLYRGVPETALLAEWGAQVPGLSPDTLASLEESLQEVHESAE